MIVSWNWLKDYVPLDMSPDELARRLTMAGLNHERSEQIDDDLAIDFEVTSNRPDCLGHLGIAREVAVLWGRALKVPAAQPPEAKPAASELVRVRIDCPDLCYRYVARVIEGVKVGPSPKWLADRLEAVGISAINNIVDISNYVLMECGQPLHTFDLAKLKGRQIIVRRPRPGETIKAIDHTDYALPSDACVIADAENAVAIGGVMGGAATEIGVRTTSLLVEAAEFDPVAIRNAARRLNLHSDSSYRFERKIDPEGVDWASRRCCQLILDLAGGRLAEGTVEAVGGRVVERKPIVLRYSQLKRILGIEIDCGRVRELLAALGVVETAADAAQLTVVAPSWRRDLTREIDLVEEVGRIHGYEKIPEDVRVPMVSSVRTREDRVLAKVRHVLTASGLDEAMTLSAVDESLSAAFSPWSDSPPLVSQIPVLRGANRLRRSLAPSLLAVRRTNESLCNPQIELFEIARVYLSRTGQLPAEELTVSLTSGRNLATVRGIVEALVAALNPAIRLEAAAVPPQFQLLDQNSSCQLFISDDPRGAARGLGAREPSALSDRQLLGFVGPVSVDGLRQFDLRGPTVVAELKLSLLANVANLVPRYEPLAPYPPVARDLNLVVDERIRWADVAQTVEATCGEYFEELIYRDTYRDAQRLGAGKKSLLLTFNLRWKQGTLTNQQADEVRDRIVAACREAHGAELRA